MSGGKDGCSFNPDGKGLRGTLVEAEKVEYELVGAEREEVVHELNKYEGVNKTVYR